MKLFIAVTWSFVYGIIKGFAAEYMPVTEALKAIRKVARVLLS